MRKISKILATLLSAITLVSSASIVGAMDSGSSSKPTNLDESATTGPGLMECFVELTKLTQQMSREMARMELFIQGVRLAYTKYRRVENVVHCTLENRETIHVTRRMLKALREENTGTLEECICDLQSVIATRIPESVVRPADETKDQLYALAIFSRMYADIKLGGGVAIPRDYLISILSIAKKKISQPDEFYVNNVEISYMNGRMKITCRNGEEITYEATIGKPYRR